MLSCEIHDGALFKIWNCVITQVAQFVLPTFGNENKLYLNNMVQVTSSDFGNMEKLTAAHEVTFTISLTSKPQLSKKPLIPVI